MNDDLMKIKLFLIKSETDNQCISKMTYLNVVN